MIRLEHERLSRGWSKAELARRATMNAVTVGAIENRRLQPYRVQLLKLAQAFGLPSNRAHELLEDLADDSSDEAIRQSEEAS